ncbi:prostacyclin synthase-like [Eucyclogobius newberryi]|uniref:prostacyclin synthase-like n=1 Tax=Eucyclogobius newberryi TaxID=166745 RepID=UPI003B5B86E6
MIWTIILLIQAGLLYFVLTHRKRYKTDPPLDKGVIPWLGHALEFGKDAFKFLSRMKMKHGDIFTVRVAGRYVSVLLDPFSYDSVLYDKDCLDFSRYAAVLMDRIFQLQLPHHLQNKSKAIMKQHIHGMNLSVLNKSMSRHLHNLLKAKLSGNQKDWKDEGLFNFSYGLLFKAGYLTLFGGEQNNNGMNPSKIYEEYRKFDGLLTKLARGTLKPEEKKLAQCVRQRLCKLLSPVGSGKDSGAASWVHAYRRLLQDEGADRETQDKALLMQLWSSQGNAGPATFWLLGFLLTNPDAMTAVKEEFSAISQTSETCLLNVKTPVFDSALEETLRLTAAPFITREVVRDKTIHMADGQEYLLRKGDRVCLFPLLSPQMDPEIHSEPQKFKHDRFLNQDCSPKMDFYKKGRRCKYYTMPWGAGTNGCVGKQLAISAIRQFVYLVLTKCELELCNPNAQMPQVNTSRYGFGVLQPEGELRVRYKWKQTMRDYE